MPDDVEIAIRSVPWAEQASDTTHRLAHLHPTNIMRHASYRPGSVHLAESDAVCGKPALLLAVEKNRLQVGRLKVSGILESTARQLTLRIALLPTCFSM